MITTFYPPYSFGGDGIFVHRLSNELARRGYPVDVIHCKDAYRLMGGRPVGAYDEHPNVTVHGLHSPFGVLSPMATQQTGFPLFKAAAIRRILAKGFDVIHYHNISLLGPKVLEYGTGIKLYTMHEYWLVCPTHVLFKFNSAACVKPSCFLCTLAYKRPPQWWRYSGLLQAAAKHVDAFIAPSRFAEEKHREMGLRARIARLPHFVPEISAAKSAANETHDEPYFLYVGRLERLKGIQTLIPIFRRYEKARLLIAGSGTYASELRQLAADSENIRFLGHRSEQELGELYRKAVAVIVPSLGYETFLLAIAEALKYGTPAVVRALGAVPEMIEETGAGFVYRTEAELLAAMEILVADPEKRRALGNRGHEAYRRNWTVEVHLARYFELIHEIAASKSPGREGLEWAP
jgi:glycosyltransferase involved in cell wall biosynthesis